MRVQPVLPDNVDEWQDFLGCAHGPTGFGAHVVALAPPFEDWRKQNLDKKLSGMVLVVLYAMVMFRPVLLLVVMLAIVDSWYDFRARLANSGPPVE